MRTCRTVAPGWESMLIVPPWRSATMRRAMSRPRPVPLPVLCGVERLECAGRDVRWHAGAGVADFNDDVFPVSPGRYSQSAGAVHRVDGVIDEIGPHLVEFAGVGVDPGDDAVVTYDVDVVELVAEHHQGAFEAVADVDALDRSSVHL